MKLHRSDLLRGELTLHDGIPLTTVARTVRDLLAAKGRIDLVRQAIGNARKEGFIDDAESRRLRRVVKKHTEALAES